MQHKLQNANVFFHCLGMTYNVIGCVCVHMPYYHRCSQNSGACATLEVLDNTGIGQ